MTLGRHYARAGADQNLIREAADELRRSWDPSEEFTSPDGDCSAGAHARAILGMLATGADFPIVKGYLRRAEEAALGEARTTSAERRELVEKLWRMMAEVAIHNYKADPGSD